MSRKFVLDGVPVTLIDTPGFDDTTLSDTDILKKIASYLTESYVASVHNDLHGPHSFDAYRYVNGRRLSGIVYLHRISDYRMGGISRKNFSMFRKLCGDDTLKNVAIVTNMWPREITELELEREAQLKTDPLLFKPVLDQKAKMLRHFNTEESARNIIRHLIHNHPEVLQIQREIVDEKKDIVQTQACVELDDELEKLRQEHKREMQDLREQMEEALRERDEQRRMDLEATRRAIETARAEAENARAQLSEAFALERRRLRNEMYEMRRALQHQSVHVPIQHERKEQRTQPPKAGRARTFFNKLLKKDGQTPDRGNGGSTNQNTETPPPVSYASGKSLPRVPDNQERLYSRWGEEQSRADEQIGQWWKDDRRS